MCRQWQAFPAYLVNQPLDMLKFSSQKVKRSLTFIMFPHDGQQSKVQSMIFVTFARYFLSGLQLTSGYSSTIACAVQYVGSMLELLTAHFQSIHIDSTCVFPDISWYSCRLLPLPKVWIHHGDAWTKTRRRSGTWWKWRDNLTPDGWWIRIKSLKSFRYQVTHGKSRYFEYEEFWSHPWGVDGGSIWAFLTHRSDLKSDGRSDEKWRKPNSRTSWWRPMFRHGRDHWAWNRAWWSPCCDYDDQVSQMSQMSLQFAVVVLVFFNPFGIHLEHFQTEYHFWAL